MRILIIDDEALTKCAWIIQFLELTNVNYEIALNMEDGLEKIEKRNFDGIILDMKFPISRKHNLEEKRTGEILLEKMKQQNIKIPVLGNSTITFLNVKYPLFCGQMKMFNSYENLKKLSEFLENIKEQS